MGILFTKLYQAFCSLQSCIWMETDVLGTWPLAKQTASSSGNDASTEVFSPGGHTDGKTGRGWISLEPWHKSPQEVCNLIQKVLLIFLCFYFL